MKFYTSKRNTTASMTTLSCGLDLHEAFLTCYTFHHCLSIEVAYFHEEKSVIYRLSEPFANVLYLEKKFTFMSN